MLYDIDTQAPIGLGNIHLFNRQLVYEKKMRPNYVDPIEDKESDKWYTPNLQARDEVLNESKQIVYVSDRESDIYEVLATLPNDKTDIIVRSKSNRKIGDNQYSATKIEDYLNKTKSQHKIEFYHDFKVNGIHKRKLIKASIKFGEVKIKRPDKSVHLKNYEDDIRYNLVEVKELGSWNENKRHRINWILLTTLNVKSIEEALEVVGFYKKRWNIEEFFRLMKSEGFNIEQTELEKGSSIRKLTIMIMEASMLILKLKSGRSVESTIRLIECFDENQIKCLEGLNRKLEGNTDKQKNPYSIESLSYASWIIARLGGWMGYQSQRAPGTITFKKGLESFCAIYIGYSIANVKHDVYKR